MAYSFKNLETIHDAEDAMSRCISEKVASGCDQQQAIAICYNEMRGELSQPQQVYLLPITGVIGEDFTYADMLMHINAAKDSPAIKLVINSPGGFVDEADKMKDLLRGTKKNLYAVNSGDVASAAVDLFLTAPRQNRKFNPDRGEFVIHNPFVDPKDGGVTGTSDDIQLAADQLKQLEENLIKEYVKATGSTSEVIRGFMDENKPLTAEQIEQLGFATIEHQEFKAVAYYKLNKNNMSEMKLDQASTEKLTGIENLLKKVLNFFKAKNLVIQDTDGKELDFGEAVKAPEEIIVGVAATIDGAPAEGDHTLADGTVYKFAAGKLAEIVPPASEELAALKAENDRLKGELSTAQANLEAAQNTNTEIQKEVEKVQTEFVAFRNQFSKGDPPANTPESGGDTARHAYKSKSE